MTTRVTFLRQWTFRTKSDHDALFVEVRLSQRKRAISQPRTGVPRRHRAGRLRLCTANLGGHFDETNLRQLLNLQPDILACQEASDQKWIRLVCEEYGYQLLEGEPTGPGQAATPTFAGHRVDVRKPGRWKQLIGAEPIGPGAGPDRSKPKWWLRTWLAVDGIPFAASSWHATASQQNKPRFRAALREARAWVTIAANLRRPVFTLGDTNSDYQQPLTRWILRHGMTSNHEQLAEVATEGSRSIDAVCVQRGLVKA